MVVFIRESAGLGTGGTNRKAGSEWGVVQCRVVSGWGRYISGRICAGCMTSVEWVGSGAVNISEPRENWLFDCVVDPSPKCSERGDLY